MTNIAFHPLSRQCIARLGITSLCLQAPVAAAATATQYFSYSREAVFALGGALTLGLLFVGLIVTQQRKELEKARREAEKQAEVLDHILEGTNVGTWQWNIQTGETQFNQRWAEMIGYSLQEISPTTIDTWMKFAHPDDLANSESQLQSHFDGRSKFYEIEARMRHKDGHWIWVLDIGRVATWTADGKPEWMYGTHQDISKRKDLESQLTKRTAEAEAALKVKSEFLAAMSHEIRTPMNGVLGLAELALAEKNATKRDNYIEGIQRSGKLLMGILNDVLDFSRLEAGRTKLQLESFDVRGLLTESVELFKASAETKQLSLSLYIAENVPSRLLGDPIKVSQMTNNFVGNAIKFTARGSISLAVSCEEVQDKIRLILECKDTGIGISEEELKQLFRPFSQVTKDARVKAAGTGLGLVLVQEYAKLMDGTCGVNSTPGRGSVFWFDVLLDKAEEQTTLTIANESIDPAALHGKHLLIVEDHSMNVMIIEAILDQHQITHEVANNGVEAIRLFEASFEPGRRQFDAILMDVQMPVMNGLEATKIIKANQKPSPPILGLTAAVLPDEVAECRKAGMESFIGKPIDTKVLFSELIRLTTSAPPP